jgi:hypothetical protein
VHDPGKEVEEGLQVIGIVMRKNFLRTLCGKGVDEKGNRDEGGIALLSKESVSEKKGKKCA